MTIYDWPSDEKFQANRGVFRVSSVSLQSRSPYTGSPKAASLAQIWIAQLSFHGLDLHDAHEMAAFLSQLEGPVNPVRIWDRWKPGPQYLTGGKRPFSDGRYFSDGSGWRDGYELSLLNAATRGDKVVVLAGLPVSTQVFRAGNVIGIGDYGYEIRNSVSSNASGQAAVNIQPGLRASVAAADPVSIYRVKIRMRLANDSDAQIERYGSKGQPFSLLFTEDVP